MLPVNANRSSLEVFDTMAKFPLLVLCLIFCFFGAHALTLQRPSVISQPQLEICDLPAAGASSLHDPLLSWQAEAPPAGFNVELRYSSRIRDLDKFDVWLGIIINIARVAQNPWNRVLTTSINFPESHNFALKAISSRTPPQYQTKSILWTLQKVFQEYVRREQYSSASITTKVNDQLLGFATIKSTLASKTSRAIEPRADSLITSPQLGRRGLDIRLDYVPNGALVTDAGFIGGIIQALIWSAQRNHDAPGVASIYKPDEDYTTEVAPMSYESRDDLKFKRVIEVLGKLPAIMYAERRGGRWAELKGLIKFDGLNIGRIIVQKGRIAGCAGSNVTAKS
ncbi:MAG: hypothetical protein Q9166_002226 [cf. Caloplaca sp. 2 TL-2023]